VPGINQLKEKIMKQKLTKNHFKLFVIVFIIGVVTIVGAIIENSGINFTTVEAMSDSKYHRGDFFLRFTEGVIDNVKYRYLPKVYKGKYFIGVCTPVYNGKEYHPYYEIYGLKKGIGFVVYSQWDTVENAEKAIKKYL
jgi:hypothetical protein